MDGMVVGTGDVHVHDSIRDEVSVKTTLALSSCTTDSEQFPCETVWGVPKAMVKNSNKKTVAVLIDPHLQGPGNGPR